MCRLISVALDPNKIHAIQISRFSVTAEQSSLSVLQASASFLTPSYSPCLLHVAARCMLGAQSIAQSKGAEFAFQEGFLYFRGHYDT